MTLYISSVFILSLLSFFSFFSFFFLFSLSFSLIHSLTPFKMSLSLTHQSSAASFGTVRPYSGQGKALENKTRPYSALPLNTSARSGSTTYINTPISSTISVSKKHLSLQGPSLPSLHHKQSVASITSNSTMYTITTNKTNNTFRVSQLNLEDCIKDKAELRHHLKQRQKDEKKKSLPLFPTERTRGIASVQKLVKPCKWARKRWVWERVWGWRSNIYFLSRPLNGALIELELTIPSSLFNNLLSFTHILSFHSRVVHWWFNILQEILILNSPQKTRVLFFFFPFSGSYKNRFVASKHQQQDYRNVHRWNQTKR